MSFQKSSIIKTFLFCLITASATLTAVAQKPVNVIVPEKKPIPYVKGNNLYCAGYIREAPINTANTLIGAQKEADKYNYSENDFMYINMGNDKGVKVGDKFAVVRPRGEVNSEWTHKGYLGFYVQEVGDLEVVSVKQDFSVARVTFSCDSLLLGDLVEPIPNRASPTYMRDHVMDPFADPSGKAQGRVLMGRDNAEAMAKDFIMYVDIGAEEMVKIGDRLTVFRELGEGNLTGKPRQEDTTSRDYGFHSEVYRGSKFSNQATRKSGSRAYGNEVTTKRAKHNRPLLRNVVGEAVVINVRERTATVVVTHNTQEIHTGDWVELQ